jgi:hypothetical protein
MKCPYNRKTETHVQQWTQRPNESGQITKGVTIDNWTYEMADCEKENCGAWHNGHCCYAAVNLNN